MNDLYLLAINLTRRCNLACNHCYLDANTLKHGSSDELSCSEICAVLDNVAEHNPETMVVLTGGEPLLRSDLENMIQHGSDLGLAMVVGTNGIMLTEKRVLPWSPFVMTTSGGNRDAGKKPCRVSKPVVFMSFRFKSILL